MATPRGVRLRGPARRTRASGLLLKPGPPIIARGPGSALTTLSGWSSDISQRALLEIVSDSAELDYLPPLAVPPAGVTERPIMRYSVSVPAMSGRVDDATYAGYTTVAEEVGVPHLLVDGVDVTYFRGVPVFGTTSAQSASDTSAQPFGDTVATFDLPQLTPFEATGAGDLAWLVDGASVEVVMRRSDGLVTRLWAGHLISPDDGNDQTSAKSAWSAEGALFQAAWQGHRVPTILDPSDIGTMIPTYLNGVISRRYPGIAKVATGINTTIRGAYTDSEMSYCQGLLATAWTATPSQWTIAKKPGTARSYQMLLKDFTTVTATLTCGARGVVTDLSRDLTATANVIFGRGVAVNGYSWAGWIYPDPTGNAPDYPYADPSVTITIGSADAGTLTGHGVSDWQRRVNELNLTGNVPISGTYSAGDAAVCETIQADYGLLVDGVVGPQTWAATFAVGSDGGNLNGAYRKPLAIDPRVEPNLYSANGAVTGPNPAYDPSILRFERDIDYGAGVSKAEATASAVLELARSKDTSLTGTITLTTDPRECSRFFISPGANVKLLGFRGGNPVLHVVSVQRNWSTLDVVLTVDQSGRDALTLASIIARNKAARDDPSLRPNTFGLLSRVTVDTVVDFDGESNGGIVPRLALFGGLWTVIYIPVSQQGNISLMSLATSSPPSPFCFALFGAPVTPAHLVNLVGDPLTGTNPFSTTAASADALDGLGFIEAFGGPGSAAGYWPGQQSSDPLTGRDEETAAISYVSAKPPWVWLAIWSPTSCFIQGRLYPAPIQ